MILVFAVSRKEDKGQTPQLLKKTLSYQPNEELKRKVEVKTY
jgi:hypothetical protein